MPFAAFLVKPEPGATTRLEIVLNPEGDDRTNASKGVAHQPEQGTVTQTDEFASIDRFQQLAHLAAREHRRLATCDHELGAAHGAGGSGDQDAARHQIVEQLANRSQVLFDARLSNFGAQLFDICGDRDTLDVFQAEVMVVAPVEEAFYRARTPSAYCGCGWSR